MKSKALFLENNHCKNIYQFPCQTVTGKWLSLSKRGVTHIFTKIYMYKKHLLFSFQNCFSGITVILLGCAGSISTLRAQGFLLLSLVVTIVNLVNLVILEVGEWRGFLSSEDRDFIKSNQLEAMMYSAYLCTTISTVLAMIVSFLASQHAFCFQQLLAEKEIAAINNNNNKNRNPNGNIVHHHNFDEEELDDSLMPKVTNNFFRSY